MSNLPTSSLELPLHLQLFLYSISHTYVMYLCIMLYYLLKHYTDGIRH